MNILAVKYYFLLFIPNVLFTRCSVSVSWSISVRDISKFCWHSAADARHRVPCRHRRPTKTRQAQLW